MRYRIGDKIILKKGIAGSDWTQEAVDMLGKVVTITNIDYTCEYECESNDIWWKEDEIDHEATTNIKLKEVIDYKEVVDYLNSLITNDYGKKWYHFELSNFYNSDKEMIIVIHLCDFGCDNKYRLYHSGLNEVADTREKLISHCMSELRKEFDNIKNTMIGILSNHVIIESF